LASRLAPSFGMTFKLFVKGKPAQPRLQKV